MILATVAKSSSTGPRAAFCLESSVYYNNYTGTKLAFFGAERRHSASGPCAQQPGPAHARAASKPVMAPPDGRRRRIFFRHPIEASSAGVLC